MVYGSVQGRPEGLTVEGGGGCVVEVHVHGHVHVGLEAGEGCLDLDGRGARKVVAVIVIVVRTEMLWDGGRRGLRDGYVLGPQGSDDVERVLPLRRGHAGGVVFLFR